MVDELERAINDLEGLQSDIETITEKRMDKTAEEITTTMEALLEQQGAVTRAERAKDSVRWSKGSPLRGKQQYSIKAGGEEFNADHVPFIEFGTGSKGVATSPQFSFQAPDGVPPDKVRQWLFLSRDFTGNIISDSLVWRIKRSIDKFGTKAQPFFRRAINIHRNSPRNAGERALRDALRNY